jgi:hypothetical protein
VEIGDEERYQETLLSPRPLPAYREAVAATGAGKARSATSKTCDLSPVTGANFRVVLDWCATTSGQTVRLHDASHQDKMQCRPQPRVEAWAPSSHLRRHEFIKTIKTAMNRPFRRNLHYLVDITLDFFLVSRSGNPPRSPSCAFSVRGSNLRCLIYSRSGDEKKLIIGTAICMRRHVWRLFCMAPAPQKSAMIDGLPGSRNAPRRWCFASRRAGRMFDGGALRGSVRNRRDSSIYSYAHYD